MLLLLHCLLIGRTPYTEWRRCRNATMTGYGWGLVAYRAVQRVDARRTPGDIVEAGVWLGGLSCYMARAHMASDSHAPTRLQWLFDTFDGMPAPGDGDDNATLAMWDEIEQRKRGRQAQLPVLNVDAQNKWAYGALEIVQGTMARSGAPTDSLHFVKGKVEETLSSGREALPRQIAILRLDTDFYASTTMELEVLWPRVSPGGWLYVDDYFAFGGARKAVDDWLERNRWTNEARRVGAFNHSLPGGYGTRFNLWKADPYSSTRPFAT